MLGILSRLLVNMLIGVCIWSLSLVFLSLATLLRLLPRLLAFVRVLLRGFLILSFRLYFLLLQWLNRGTCRYFHLDLVRGLPRVIACTLLSLLIGLAALVLLQLFDQVEWVIGLSLVHGFIVSLAWDELQAPGGIQLGTRMR